ncbi:MAG: ATP-binding protein [Bacteroidetes bacterium]|nr:ATP-binding protein [Bacteroidota bacterium]
MAAFIVVVAEFITNVSPYFHKNWISLLVVFAIAFITTFIIFYFLLEKFIYRKIKLIYKTISNFRSAKEKSTGIHLGDDIIGGVSQEVMDWQKNRSDEITELKRMESFRKEFLGNVSHELKTPIFNIQGYIHTLLEGGIDDKEVNLHYLQRASKSVDRLCLIVEDLESISKLEAGEMILEQRVFDMHELVHDVFESMEMQTVEKKIKLGFKEESDRSFFVYADKERIRQVLVNLIVNSIKYGKENGLTLVGFYDMDENILVEITDNGIGIEQEHLPRLFERFYRVDKSRSREAGGTGLGLAIVKHIIEAHQQSINVRSTFGIGTTFAFTLKKAR